jgi:hypothetical protein
MICTVAARRRLRALKRDGSSAAETGTPFSGHDQPDPTTTAPRSERVASNDKASGPADESVEGSWSPRRPKASAKKVKDDDKGATPDPEVLAEDIERTREELAETLDAIAEKVSPKKVASRTKKKVGDAVKEGASDAADSIKDTAADAADAVKHGVAAAKAKVAADDDALRSPLGQQTSVELDAATPVSGAQVPVEPAPTPGALADATVTRVEPAGADTPSYPATLPPASPSRTPLLAGAGAALVVLLLLMRRRRRR